MAAMGINPDARGLEEAFFGKENAKLLANLRAKAERRAQLDALRQVARVDDEAFLERLLDLGIRAETVLALTLVPLTFVAWADGRMDPAEREAILRAAENRGIDPGSPGHALLTSWLSRPPEPHLLENWRDYVRSIWTSFSAEERAEMRRNMADRARMVAEAAGGFLGLTSKISPAERAVLADIDSTLA